MVLCQVQTKFSLIQLIAQTTNQKSKRFPYRSGHVGNCLIFLFVIGVFVVFLRYEKKGSSIHICKRKSFPYKEVIIDSFSIEEYNCKRFLVALVCIKGLCLNYKVLLCNHLNLQNILEVFSTLMNKDLGGVWLWCLNNTTRIFTTLFTHMYFHNS